MKSNKSLLILLGSILFILSSCSQAKYGSMMRKTKASKVEQIASKTVDKDTKDEVVVEPIGNQNQVEIAQTADIEQPASSTTSDVSTTIAEPKSGEKVNSFKEVLAKSPLPNTKKIKKVKNDIQNKLEKNKQADSDIASLLLLILIIILILAIIDLILKFLPGPFSAIVYLIILILLVLWLLNMLN